MKPPDATAYQGQKSVALKLNNKVRINRVGISGGIESDPEATYKGQKVESRKRYARALRRVIGDVAQRGAVGSQAHLEATGQAEERQRVIRVYVTFT